MTERSDGTSRDVQLVVDRPDEGQRLDVFLAARVPELSRSRIQRLIRDGFVTVDGRPEKVSTHVGAGARVSVRIPDAQAVTPLAESLPLTIVYDDRDIVVIDKAAGMVVHPSAGHASGTVVNALLHHVGDLSGIGGEVRPGIVHRLDKGTSGLMVIAKHDRAHHALSRQFHDRQVTKEYVALVWGVPQRGQVFDQPLGRDPRHRKRISTRAPRARPAVTTIEDVEPLDGLSLVKLSIGTGRTHQIRAHLADAGFPIAGDELYGGVRKKLPHRRSAAGRLTRPFLHASRLAFSHPADGRPMSFDAPLPADLSSVLDALRRAMSQGESDGRA